jgi:hypothetical protein
MKRIRVIQFLVLLVVGAPVVFACEKCLSPGGLDPVGNPITYYRCWDDSAGQYSSCVSGTSTERCATWTDSSCPAGGGAGGGGGRLPGLEPASVPPTTTLGECNVDLAGTCRASRDVLSAFLE